MAHYFIADLHYGQDNIVRYCKRPVMTLEEYNRVERGEVFHISPETRERHHDLLVNGVNSCCREKDTLWVIGDAGNYQALEEFVSRIKVKDLRLIRGNHDSPGNEHYFHQVFDLFEFWCHEFFLVLCHYPLKSWHRSHKGAVQLHGHVHSGDISLPHELQFNLCADVINFRPYSIEDIRQRVAERWSLYQEHIRQLGLKDKGEMTRKTEKVF